MTADAYDRAAKNTGGFYDAQVGEALQHSRWHLRVRRLLTDMLFAYYGENRAPVSLLDAGCGRGDLILELVQRFPQFHRLCGVDFSKEVLLIANRLLDSAKSVVLKEGQLLQLPIASREYELILCVNTLHHVLPEDQPQALGELARCSSRTILLEIKNGRDIYYRYFHSRKTFLDVDIYPTTVQVVVQELAKHGYKLIEERGIFWLRVLSPNVLLLFERGR